jgi:hypothetical protein
LYSFRDAQSVIGVVVAAVEGALDVRVGSLL